jgi:catechol 2,3-dioxygenase-like lactoylglutathione lyase family enzyme
MRRTARGGRVARARRNARTRAVATRRPTRVAAIPKGYHTVTPHLTVRGAAEAIEFYTRAFGARERGRMPMPDGKAIMHAELLIGNSIVFLADEFPDMLIGRSGSDGLDRTIFALWRAVGSRIALDPDAA